MPTQEDLLIAQQLKDVASNLSQGLQQGGERRFQVQQQQRQQENRESIVQLQAEIQRQATIDRARDQFSFSQNTFEQRLQNQVRENEVKTQAILDTQEKTIDQVARIEGEKEKKALANKAVLQEQTEDLKDVGAQRQLSRDRDRTLAASDTQIEVAKRNLAAREDLSAAEKELFGGAIDRYNDALVRAREENKDFDRTDELALAFVIGKLESGITGDPDFFTKLESIPTEVEKEELEIAGAKAAAQQFKATSALQAIQAAENFINQISVDGVPLPDLLTDESANSDDVVTGLSTLTRNLDRIVRDASEVDPKAVKRVFIRLLDLFEDRAFIETKQGGSFLDAVLGNDAVFFGVDDTDVRDALMEAAEEVEAKAQEVGFRFPAPNITRTKTKKKEKSEE